MGKIKDLTGQRFGRLTVISRGENDNKHRCTWNCECDCGNLVNVKSLNLVNGGTSSCGCIRVNDLSGQKFGRLTVVKKEENIRSAKGKSYVMYLCRCECGNSISVKAENLRSGNTKSCGCLERDINRARMTKHGLKGTRIYIIWRGMKSRCFNKNEPSYERYGARGITVCDEWKNNFQAFYDWSMANGYTDELTIDRINNCGNYEPSNCKWSTNKEQQRNKSNNRIVYFDGENVPLSVVSEKTGINRGTLANRIDRGMTIDEAVNFKKKVITLTYKGKVLPMKDWCVKFGLNYSTVYHRYLKGLPVEKILSK